MKIVLLNKDIPLTESEFDALIEEIVYDEECTVIACNNKDLREIYSIISESDTLNVNDYEICTIEDYGVVDKVTILKGTMNLLKYIKSTIKTSEFTNYV